MILYLNSLVFPNLGGELSPQVRSENRLELNKQAHCRKISSLAAHSRIMSAVGVEDSVLFRVAAIVC